MGATLSGRLVGEQVRLTVGEIVDAFSPLAVGIVPSGTGKADHLGGLGFFLCSVFSSWVLPSSSGGQPRDVATACVV